MKLITLSFILILLGSCQRKAVLTEMNQLNLETSPNNEGRIEFCVLKQNVKQNLKPRKKKKLVFNGNLVAHENFIFLEHLELDDHDFVEMEEVTEKYSDVLSLAKSYKLESGELLKKYNPLIGSKVQVNNYNRTQFYCTIVDLVIIHDKFVEQPYLAAVTDLKQTDQSVYYAWVSSIYSNSSNFELVDEEASYCCPADTVTPITLAYNKFVSEPFYINYNALYEDETDGYASVDIKQFQDSSGKIYLVIQNRSTGACESIIESQLAIYELNGDVLHLTAKGESDQYFIDLIDVDADGIPEILAGDFSSSSIYISTSGKLKQKSGLSWSSEGCPC